MSSSVRSDSTVRSAVSSVFMNPTDGTTGSETDASSTNYESYDAYEASHRTMRSFISAATSINSGLTSVMDCSTVMTDREDSSHHMTPSSNGNKDSTETTTSEPFYVTLNENDGDGNGGNYSNRGALEDKYVKWTTPCLTSACCFGGLKNFTASSTPEDISDILVNPMALPTIPLILYYFCGGMSRMITQNYHKSISAYFVMGSQNTFVSTYLLVASLPHYLRILLALWTDSQPLRCSTRRKPYMYLGLASFMLGNCLLSLFSSLSNDMDKIGMLIGVFILEVGVNLQFVTANAMLVERSRMTDNWVGGAKLLISCTFVWYVGEGLASVLNEYVFGNAIVRAQSVLNGLVSLVVFGPMLPHLFDPCVNSDLIGLQSTTQTVLDQFKNTSIWAAIIFIWYFNSLDVALFANLQIMTSYDNGGIGIDLNPWMQCALFAIGVLIYRTCLFNKSWHKTLISYVGLMVLVIVLYIFLRPSVTAAKAAFSVNYLFEPFQNLPIRIVILTLCPQGAEATMMVLLTYFRNSFALVAGRSLFDVFTDTVGRNNEFLSVAMILCGMMMLSVLLVQYLFPRYIQDRILEMRKQEEEEWAIKEDDNQTQVTTTTQKDTSVV